MICSRSASLRSKWSRQHLLNRLARPVLSNSVRCRIRQILTSISFGSAVALRGRNQSGLDGRLPIGCESKPFCFANQAENCGRFRGEPLRSRQQGGFGYGAGATMPRPDEASEQNTPPTHKSDKNQRSARTPRRPTNKCHACRSFILRPALSVWQRCSSGRGVIDARPSADRACRSGAGILDGAVAALHQHVGTTGSVRQVQQKGAAMRLVMRLGVG